MYNAEPGGNFHDEATGTKTGANIFHLTSPPAEIATGFKHGPKDFYIKLEAVRTRLFDRREKRIHPHKDDKILTDWNGLMIGALALGARILADDACLQAAAKGAGFVLSRLRRNGKLLHRYRDGESAVDAMLCDYAYLVWGLLELYGANHDPDILGEAIRLNRRMLDLFWDDTAGGLFLTPEDGEELLVRPKEIYDGALPSGNSVALYNLLRLESLCGDPDLGTKARLLIGAFSAAIQEVPSAYTQFLSGLHFALSPTTEVVIVGNVQSQDTREMLAIMNTYFFPNTVTLVKDPKGNGAKLAGFAPFTADHEAEAGRATAYVCRNYSCKSPTSDAKEFLTLLRS